MIEIPCSTENCVLISVLPTNLNCDLYSLRVCNLGNLLLSQNPQHQTYCASMFDNLLSLCQSSWMNKRRKSGGKKESKFTNKQSLIKIK